MGLEDYLLEKVSSDEFTELKNREEIIIRHMLRDIDYQWRAKVQDIKATFKYNTSRDIVSIFIEKDGQQQLVSGNHKLSNEEYAVANSLYSSLEKELFLIRLPKERWVDSVST
jgi:hypothetical protein